MTFSIIPEPTFDFVAPVTKPGTNTLLQLPLKGKNLGRKATLAWTKSAGEPGPDGKPQEDVDYLMQVIVGWGPEVQANGEPIPFNRDNFENLLDGYPTSGNEIYVAYLKALTEAAKGN
jgi:hypothetical protein